MCGTSTKQIPPTLCIGVDLAWFGGSAGNRYSQYDCIGAVLIGGDNTAAPTLKRVRLENRDRDGHATSTAITDLIQSFAEKKLKRVVLALDAPIQAAGRVPLLPPRTPVPAKGTVKRRACENELSDSRQSIDHAGGANGWHPNIQPGAPLAPRVASLLAKLTDKNVALTDTKFALWTRGNRDATCLVTECFPAEAIWAAKRQGGYGDLTATCAKAYKKQSGVRLTREQVTLLVHNALDAFAALTGDANHWNLVVEFAIQWMLKDQTWQVDGQYRGGKLFDDVVDTLICLATSLSFARGCAHVWRCENKSEDGHIMGPGFPVGSPWVQP